MDESLLREAIKGLVAAGPVAMVLGYFAHKFWTAYQDLLKDYLSLLKGILDTDGDGKKDQAHGSGS